MIKILIADDQQLICGSLKIILNTQKDFKVIGTVANGKEVLEFIKKQKPDIKVIILTTFDDDDFIFSALKYGASGYLLKGGAPKDIFKAIRTVYSGGAVIKS